MNPVSFGLSGAPNFRDFGGRSADGGRRVRSKRLFRSDSLARLTDADMVKIAALNIELLYDLRNEDERARDPNRWQPAQGVETLAGLDSNELAAVRFFGWRERIGDPAFNVASGRQWMLNAYGAMPRLFAPCLTSIFERIGSACSPVTLLHCSAGKDRTGFVCAMLLLALGVPRDDVIDEYLLTRQLRPPEDLLKTMLGRELQNLSDTNHAALLTMAGVHEDYLETALRTLDRDFGGVEAYLAQACYLDSARRSKLHSQLLE